MGWSLDMSLREWIDYYQANVAMRRVHYRAVSQLGRTYSIFG
jgi:hypothetical protein